MLLVCVLIHFCVRLDEAKSYNIARILRPFDFLEGHFAINKLDH